MCNIVLTAGNFFRRMAFPAEEPVDAVMISTFTMAVFAVQAVMTLSSPATGAIFYMNGDVYNRGPLLNFYLLMPMVSWVVMLAAIVPVRRNIPMRQAVFILFYLLVPAGCTALQAGFIGLSSVPIGITIVLLLTLMNILFENEVAIKEQEKTLAEMNNDLLLSQIKPHFLYNSLGSIAELCRVDPAKAG